MKELFNKLGRWILGVRQPEQERASGGPAGTENSQTTGPTEPNLEEAGHGRGPVIKESKIEWNPGQRCLVVETKRDLELGSLRTVVIWLYKGNVHVVGTDEVKQPELTITEMVYAGSEDEAIDYQKNSFVGVNADWNSLLVIGKTH